MNRFTLVMVALLLWAVDGLAAEVTLQVQPPSTYCSGESLDANLIEETEIYSDIVPIPYPDVDCANEELPSVPTPGDIYTIPGGGLSIPVNLSPGVTYYFRARVKVNGIWGPLSDESVKTIALPVPNAPALIVIGG